MKSQNFEPSNCYKKKIICILCVVWYTAVFCLIWVSYTPTKYFLIMYFFQSCQTKLPKLVSQGWEDASTVQNTCCFVDDWVQFLARTWWLRILSNASSRWFLFWPLWTLHICDTDAHTHTHADQTLKHIKQLNLLKNNPPSNWSSLLCAKFQSQ